jgi:hypothetical protein
VRGPYSPFLSQHETIRGPFGSCCEHVLLPEKSLKQFIWAPLDKHIRLKEHKVTASSGATLTYRYTYLRTLYMIKCRVKRPLG